MGEGKFQEKAGSTSPKCRMVLLDSSILMYPIKGKRGLTVNIESALSEISGGAELAVLNTTMEELKILRSRAKGKTRIAADFALEFIKQLRIEVIDVDEDTLACVSKAHEEGKIRDFYDEVLIKTAKKLRASVATMDMGLAKRLKEEGVTCYFLSNRNWVIVSGNLC
ncbi:MAG: PIN domain-containing protein [Candidatus Korarchaeota archaeon]|nr:PIN domain-containing protein [Thermoproteota archaeon]